MNADEIARGLAPLHPESVALAASKLMLQRLKDLLEAGKSVAFETTAASTNYIKHLKRAREEGYEVNLLFLWLASPEQAIERVAQRVQQGGHNIPKETIVRRYVAGLKNLQAHYLELADRALILDNSIEGAEARLIALKRRSTDSITVREPSIWRKIRSFCAE